MPLVHAQNLHLSALPLSPRIWVHLFRVGKLGAPHGAGC